MPVAVAFVTDLVCVLVFVVLGRRNHDEGTAAAGVARTAAPFAIALLVGWGAARRARRPPSSLSFGLEVWAGTVVIGMLLRRFAFDRGTAAPFVIVAIVFLGTTLLGWRLVAWRVAPWGRRGTAD